MIVQDLQLNQFSILQQISDDLRQIFEQVSGKSLFDQWVFKKGHPELDINISLLDTNMLKIQVVQLQEEDPFVFPLESHLCTTITNIGHNTQRYLLMETGWPFET